MTLRLDDTGFGGLMLYQETEAFCYGIDAVLLADFAAEAAAKKKADCRIMDLGTGNGVVPLILSHKTRASYIGGIELQAEAAALAEKSAAYNGLSDRLHFFCGNVRDFETGTMAESFDVVTSNPPYTAGSCGIESRSRAKALARHELEGSLEDFVSLAARLLRDKGSFCMVHRPARMADIFSVCRKYRLEPKELRLVSGKPMERPNILLIHCCKNGKAEMKIAPQLHVHEEDGGYSRQILKIYEKS